MLLLDYYIQAQYLDHQNHFITRSYIYGNQCSILSKEVLAVKMKFIRVKTVRSEKNEIKY